MPPSKKVSVPDFEKDSVETPQFRPELLPEPERQDAVHAAARAKTLFLKALLHRHSPNEFPISEGGASLEARTTEIVQQIDVSDFDRVKAKIPPMIDHPPVIIPNIDLRKPMPDPLLLEGFHLDIKKINLGGLGGLAKSPKFNRVFLNLRKLHCVEETDPKGGADDMIMGGVMVDPSGQCKAIKSIVAGAFDTDHVQDYGNLPLSSLSLNVTHDYPKNVYGIFYLVESDSDDKEVANGLSKGCQLLATVANAAGYPTVGAAFAAVAGLVEVFAGMFIDEDEFPPYGIELRLNSELQLGGTGVGKNEHTTSIRAHGGEYRIGYRWELVA